MKNTKITAAVGIIAALVVSACNGSRMTEVYKGAIDLPKNQVEVISFTHVVDFSGDSSSLTKSEMTGIDNYLYNQGVGYGDQLSLDFATGDGAWQTKLATVNNFLKTRGYWVKYATQSGSITDPGLAALVVNRYSVVTPDCQALAEESFVPTELWTNKTFGCITTHNLGVMVANPQDLIEGQPDTLPVTYAAVRAIQLYRGRIGLSTFTIGDVGDMATLRILGESSAEQK